MSLDIVYIAELALERKKLIHNRVGKKDVYLPSELTAKTNQEVELFDSIDCLSVEELEQLLFVANAGGLEIFGGDSVSDKVSFIYLDVDLGSHLKEGLFKHGNGI